MSDFIVEQFHSRLQHKGAETYVQDLFKVFFHTVHVTGEPLMNEELN